MLTQDFHSIYDVCVLQVKDSLVDVTAAHESAKSEFEHVRTDMQARANELETQLLQAVGERDSAHMAVTGQLL